MNFKKITKLLALSLVGAMLLSNVAFAEEITPSEDETSVVDDTVTEETVEELVEELATEEATEDTEEISLAEEAAEEGLDDYGDAVTDAEIANGGEEISDAVVDTRFAAFIASAPKSADGLSGGDLNSYYVARMAEKVVAGETVKFTNSSEVATLVQLGYTTQGDNGPISITKGTLRYKDWLKWKTKDVYLVCMSGTDTNKLNQTTNWLTDLLSGFECNNLYVRNIKKSIEENIPAGSNIILTGHSLGGMVAQQVAADDDIKDMYNVMNTVTFGSPLLDAGSREGMVKRLGDTSDIVPYASVNTLKNIVWQTTGLNREDGGYSVMDTNFTAHCCSYQRADVWGSYDPCGEKNAGRTLTLDLSTTTFYQSPIVTCW